MANGIFEPEQAWRFCDVCDPHNTRSFSAERAYNKHQTSQRHLKRTGQPLQDVSCPKCGKSLSRGSIVLRHLASGQCPGRRPTPNPISEPSKKHALSVSPNGIVRKIQKSTAFDFGNAGASPHASAARRKADIVTNSAARIDMRLVAEGHADNICWSVYEPIPPHSRSNSRTVSKQVRTDKASPSSQSSKVSTGSTFDHDNVRDVLPATPIDLLLAALVGASPARQTLGSASVDHHHKEARFDTADEPNSESRTTNEERRPSLSYSDSTPITCTAALDKGKGTEDQWLSTAMESASLKDENLAYSQVQGLLSSSPATNMSSWGSLFLKHSPRIAGFGWSLSPLPKVSPPTWSSVRSAEMPAPMLTGPVDEELRMSRRTQDKQATKDTPTRILESHKRNEDLLEQILQDQQWWVSENFIDDIDFNYQSKARINRTALMLSILKRQLRGINTLFKAAFTHQKWPVLSMLDDNGDAISGLAENVNFSYQLNEVLRLFVAVACCECPESTRRDGVCGIFAREGSLEDDKLKTAGLHVAGPESFVVRIGQDVCGSWNILWAGSLIRALVS